MNRFAIVLVLGSIAGSASAGPCTGSPVSVCGPVVIAWSATPPGGAGLPVTFSRSIPQQVEFSRTVTQSVTFSRTISQTVDFSRTISQTVDFSRTISQTVDFSRTITQKVELALPGAVTGVPHVLGSASVGSTSYGGWTVPTGDWRALMETSSMYVDGTARPVFATEAVTMTSHGVLVNNSTTTTVYVGGANVTAANGIPLLPGASWVLDSTNSYGAGMYAVTASGSSDLRLGRW